MHFQMNTNYTTIKTFCGYNGLYYNQKRCFFHKEKRTRDNKTTPDEYTVTTVSVQTDANRYFKFHKYCSEGLLLLHICFL